MNKQGRQNENNERIRKIVDSKIQIQPGVFAIRDNLNNLIVVDTNTGISYGYDNNELVENNTGDKSSKENGYVYTPLYLNINGEIKLVNYATHSLVAMISHTYEYDDILLTDKTPVVNHKNNCPWDNREENLEWTTQPLNILHGKVVNSLYKSESESGWLEIMTDHRYTAIRYNQNKDNPHITLLVGLSVKDIILYEDYVVNNLRWANGTKIKSLKEYWKIKDKTDMISAYNLKGLLDWLEAHDRPLYY